MKTANSLVLIAKVVLAIAPALQTPCAVQAQSDSLWQQDPEIHLSGFADVFYVYDFNRPEGIQRQDFLYNHNRHNEVNLNLGLIKLGLSHPRYRGNLAFQAGTYVDDNYTAEEGLVKNVAEANIGLSLNRRQNLWIDAGIMPSHIGFESAISSQNWTLTRSLLAENSPYFMAGAKVSYTPNPRWEMAAMMLNGWQRIRRVSGNSLPSFGSLVNYHPNEDFTLNWSTFAGTEDRDPERRMRYFSNLFAQVRISENFGIIAGFDIGVQQDSTGSSEYQTWYSPVAIARYALNSSLKAALRVEYYRDAGEIIIPTATQQGFNTLGLSLNLDYAPNELLICRVEGRWLNSTGEVFERGDSHFRDDVFIAFSMAIGFGQKVENSPENLR